MGIFGAVSFLFVIASDPSTYSVQTQQEKVTFPQPQVVAPSVQPALPSSMVGLEKEAIKVTPPPAQPTFLPIVIEPQKETVKVTPPSADTIQLSNDNYYINVDGNSIHSPAYSDNGVPAGASAQCRDGTYSFSQNRRGTCSHHGGVAVWL